MKAKILITAVLSALALFYNSCCKHAEQPGKATLIIRIKHHDKIIPSHISHPDTVWIKFNTKEAPASTADYDKFYIFSGTAESIELKNMSCGNLFIYAAGLDSSSAASERVAGGQFIKVQHKSRKKTVDIDIAVSE